jgi:hypothetical protein
MEGFCSTQEGFPMPQLTIDSPKYGKHVVTFDVEDRATVNAHTWRLLMKGGKLYARTTVIVANGQRTAPCMHTLLTGRVGVRHLDGNGLNNRRNNLYLMPKSK